METNESEYSNLSCLFLKKRKKKQNTKDRTEK